jgi:hypothetical protein
MDTTGIGVLAVGLLLCFAGVTSLNLAVLASGFAVGWLITEPFNTSILTALFVALAAAVLAWVLAHLVFRVALFFVGGLAGAVFGAKLFGLLEPTGGNAVLAVLFIAAAAFIGGFLTQRFHQPALAAACALGGAALALSGVARAFPDSLGFLRNPNSTWEAIVAAVVWAALATAGWVVERRLVRDRTPARV